MSFSRFNKGGYSIKFSRKRRGISVNDADIHNGLHAASVFLTVVWEVSQNVLNGNNIQTFFLFPINITHSWLHGLTFILTLFLGAIILLSSSSSDYWAFVFEEVWGFDIILGLVSQES
ncbi:hypothetical protein BJH90_03625 [Bacillus halotolerans]|uniref:Uncharacterized protein n=1 Tax=Bacillus halotolerans TaxID=260554 RepID=A0A9Q6A6A9_9BACI|nr:hypothetical protein CJU60_11935 [Bacillus sp. 7705b]PLS04595.1 hypothetical protein CUU63_19085 [Bacillus halotolerans]PON02826.1 hypothetical protein BJH90_03625 [Bacillus halotolerans]